MEDVLLLEIELEMRESHEDGVWLRIRADNDHLPRAHVYHLRRSVNSSKVEGWGDHLPL